METDDSDRTTDWTDISHGELYAAYAHHYDPSYTAKTELVDERFYLDAIAEAKGPVLEIGCGTGRILLPAARAGAQIDGLDLSRPMLAILREKLAAEPAEVQARVSQLVEADMRAFRLSRRYDRITIPFRPLQEFRGIDDPLAALLAAKAHLAPGGRLLFDVFYPNYERLLGGVGTEWEEMTWTDPRDASLRVTRSFRKEGVDAAEQWFHGAFVLRWRREADGPDGEVQREAALPFRMTWYTPAQIDLLLRLAGLRTVESFGSFDRQTAVGDGPEMIYVTEAT